MLSPYISLFRIRVPDQVTLILSIHVEMHCLLEHLRWLIWLHSLSAGNLRGLAQEKRKPRFLPYDRGVWPFDLSWSQMELRIPAIIFPRFLVRRGMNGSQNNQ